MRAYHRVDPLMDEHKSHYTPAQFGAFLKVQLVAGRQTDRGYFRSVAALKAVLPSMYSRHVDFLVAEGDIVTRGTRIYVDGWEEWQEGDLTVRDRMARLRNRKRNNGGNGGVTGDGGEPSQRTQPPLPPHTPPTPPGVSDGAGVGASGANGSFDAPELPALSWLTQHGCYIAPVSGYYRQLVMAVENHGSEPVVAKFEVLKKAGVKRGDIKGFLFGAIDALNGRPDLKALERGDRESSEADQFDRRVAATQREIARAQGRAS